MTVLNWDLVWRRVSRRPEFQGRSQDQFRFSALGKQFTLTTGQQLAAQPLDFPDQAIILGVGAGVSVSAAATAEIRGLNCLRVGMDYSGSSGSIITGGRMNAAALFGNYGQRQFPAREIIIPRGNTLNIGVDNLSTSTVLFDLVFHSMIFAPNN